jgi:PAS domain S-box-containing protein
LDLANAIFLVLDCDENISLINQKGCEILDYPEDEILDKNWFDQFIPDDQREEAINIFKYIIQSPAKVAKFSEGDIMVRSGDRRTIEWHHAALTDVTGRTIGVISSGIDITDSRRAKVDLINALHEGQEQERKRISKELHDGLGQQLAAAKMLLGAVETDLAGMGKESWKLYNNALITLDGAIKDARNISHNLVQYLLEGKGLVPAIEQLCTNISQNEILQFKFRHRGMKARVNPQVEIGLFRVLQELITNIMKHAQASRVDIMLKQYKHKIILKVEDNGIGFQGSFEEMQLNGIGLRNITSRVNGLLGKVTLDSSQKQGTAVIIEIPTGKN